MQLRCAWKKIGRDIIIEWFYVIMFYEEYNVTPSVYPIKIPQHLPKLLKLDDLVLLKMSF